MLGYNFNEEEQSKRSRAWNAYKKVTNYNYKSQEEKMELLKTAFAYKAQCDYREVPLPRQIIKNPRLTWDEKIEVLKAFPKDTATWAFALRCIGKSKNKEKIVKIHIGKKYLIIYLIENIQFQI